MISRAQLTSKCLDSGRSATPQRMTIIDALDSSGKNLSAYELLDLLNAKGKLFNISTIYRVLDFWIEMGVVHKIDSSNTYLCLLYTSPSPRDQRGSRMPSSA